MVDKQASEKGKESQAKPLSRQTKILTTAAILFGNLTYGCSLNTFSPALDNMRSKYGTTIEDISVVFTIGTIAVVQLYVGSNPTSTKRLITHRYLKSIGGFISSYINRQLVVIFAITVMATAMYMAPYCPDKTMFFVSGGMLGFSGGLHDSSQMVWMIEIWQHKAGPFIQAQHLFYAIGTVVPTIIVAPFLNKYDHLKVNGTDSSTTETSSIHVPFLIIGTLASIAALFHFLLFVFYRYHTPPMYPNENFELIEDAKNIPSPIETEKSDRNVSINQQENVTVTIMGVSSRKVKLVAITVVFLGAYQAMEVSSMQFLPTFGQYSDLKMTESASSYVLTGLNGMFAIGRLIGTIIIFKVQPELIILTNFIFLIIGNLILLIWANGSLSMFWLGSMTLGIGFSTMFPSFCAFIEKYLVFTTSVASSICVFGSLVTSIYPVIIGKFIEHRAVVLTYTNLLSTSVSIVAMVWGYKLTRTSVTRER